MHQRLIVASLHEKMDSVSSRFVSGIVSDWLNDNGFSSPSGRWSNSPADWYIIGGRWSGELTKVANGIKWKDYADFAKSICTEKENEECDWDKFAHNHLIQKYKSDFNKWWVDKTGEDSLHPFNRDSYSSYGDDSQVLTKRLWKYFNSKVEGGSFDEQSEDSWIMWDDYTGEFDAESNWSQLEKYCQTERNPDDFLDEENHNDNNIWLTTVDYHN
tara:strand:- start:167 stop:811 length:645 start_codon:yes stop_codon:yes gene_type:complete